MSLAIDTLTMDESVAGGATLYWSIQYHATAAATNPRSGFVYNSGPGPITLKDGQMVYPDPTMATILETNVPSMTPGESRTDNWGDILKQMPMPTASITTCNFMVFVGELNYAESKIYVRDYRNKIINLTGGGGNGGNGGTPEPTYTIPSVNYTGDIKPGNIIQVTATVMASASATKNLNIVAEIRDSSNAVHGSATGICLISGKTMATVTIPVVVATTTPKGAGQICAYIL